MLIYKRIFKVNKMIIKYIYNTGCKNENTGFYSPSVFSFLEYSSSFVSVTESSLFIA